MGLSSPVPKCSILFFVSIGLTALTGEVPVSLQLDHSLPNAGQMFLGCVYPHLVHLFWVSRVSWCTNEADVIVGRSDHPFSLDFWYSFHWDSKSLQCVSRDVYVSSSWFCCLIQSLALWYHTACGKSMVLSVAFVSGYVNLTLFIKCCKAIG